MCTHRHRLRLRRLTSRRTLRSHGHIRGRLVAEPEVFFEGNGILDLHPDDRRGNEESTA